MIERLKKEVTALRSNPKRAVVMLGGGVLVLAGVGVLWGNRSVATWLEVQPAEMQLSVGASQPVSVSLMRNTPTDEPSWRTLSMRVVVVPGAAPPRRR